jgi:hypothetical protein
VCSPVVSAAIGISVVRELNLVHNRYKVGTDGISTTRQPSHNLIVGLIVAEGVKKIKQNNQRLEILNGGERGIRTLDRV